MNNDNDDYSEAIKKGTNQIKTEQTTFSHLDPNIYIEPMMTALNLNLKWCLLLTAQFNIFFHIKIW